MRSRTRVGLMVGLGSWLLGSAWAAEPMRFTPNQERHWAWKKPVRAPIPKVRNQAWAANPIDAFVLAQLEARGLKPPPPASPETLIRRVAFDLTGLPPTPNEVDRFVRECRDEVLGRGGVKALGKGPNTSPPHTGQPQHPSPAYLRMIDRYLASPAFGERWARHWLDLARYADTNGYEHDEVRPDAWRYRDYVVRAFNADKPYNRFILEQVAGDELAPGDPDAVIATGFNLLGPDMTDSADQPLRRQNTLNDMTDTTGLVFLGLTVGCARCHNHKYEPISQKDYYALQAFFTPARFRKDLPVGTPEELEQHQKAQAAFSREQERLRRELDAVSGPVVERLRAARIAKQAEEVRTAFAAPERERTVEQQMLVERTAKAVEPPEAEVQAELPAAARSRYRKLVGELLALEKRRPVPPVAMGLWQDGKAAPATYILGRGELANREEEVAPAFPSILARSAAPASGSLPAAAGPQRRTVLAQWLAAPENPLTARVMVNRVWQHLFGRGIVPSPSDFGVRGESATHEELLDWLAANFVGAVPGPGSRVPSRTSLDPGLGTRDSRLKPWSVKGLIRLILTSNAYRQSSRASAAALKLDPSNELFSRMNRKRLEGEAVRDAVLMVSGRLNRKMGGPGVFPPIPAEARPSAAAWPVSPDAADHTRRSLYIFVRRNLHYPDFEAFDAPDSNLSCPQRESSTTAPQALVLMNSPEMQENARRFAGRVLRAGMFLSDRVRFDLAYRMALGRSPSALELQLGQGFVEKQAALLATRPTGSLVLPQPAAEGMDAARSAAWVDYCLALLNLNEFVYVD